MSEEIYKIGRVAQEVGLWPEQLGSLMLRAGVNVQGMGHGEKGITKADLERLLPLHAHLLVRTKAA